MVPGSRDEGLVLVPPGGSVGPGEGVEGTTVGVPGSSEGVDGTTVVVLGPGVGVGGTTVGVLGSGKGVGVGVLVGAVDVGSRAGAVVGLSDSVAAVSWKSFTGWPFRAAAM